MYHKGGLYTFGVLDAEDNIFLLAFGVTGGGNENEDNWSWFIGHFWHAVTCLEDDQLDTLLNHQVLEEKGGSDDDNKSMVERRSGLS